MKTLEAAFLYKCKNCGKVFDSGDRSDPAKMKVYFHALVMGMEESAKKIFDFGVPPENKTIHHCGNNEIGVADLVGFRNQNYQQ